MIAEFTLIDPETFAQLGTVDVNSEWVLLVKPLGASNTEIVLATGNGTTSVAVEESPDEVRAALNADQELGRPALARYDFPIALALNCTVSFAAGFIAESDDDIVEISGFVSGTITDWSQPAGIRFGWPPADLSDPFVSQEYWQSFIADPDQLIVPRAFFGGPAAQLPELSVGFTLGDPGPRGFSFNVAVTYAAIPDA